MDQKMLTKQMNYEKFLSEVIKWVFFGVGITAITSILVIFSGIIYALIPFYFPVLIISVIIEIAFVWILNKKIDKPIDELSFSSVKRFFILYSIVNGVIFSFILASVSIYITALAFALTCAYFGLLYTITKYTTSSFSNIAKVCISVLPVMIIGYIILLFIQAQMLYYFILFLHLLIFTGITLYDFKMISTMYEQSSEEYQERLILFCAFELYLDFVNIFIDILMLIMDNN